MTVTTPEIASIKTQTAPGITDRIAWRKYVKIYQLEEYLFQ
jgi:hypothetical protein